MIKILKQFTKVILMLSLSSVFLLHISEVAHADTNESTYFVSPLFSGLPIEKNSGYFQLNVEPHTHYEVPLLITNNTKKYVDTRTYVQGADTSYNGNIIYNRNKFSILSNINSNRVLKYRLKPHSMKIIKYNLYVPHKLFHGTQLAGIITHFYNKNKGISNSISYINGLSLTEKKMKSNVNLLKPSSLKYDGNNAIYKLRINNDNPVLFQHLKAKIIIHGNHSQKYKFDDVNIAPNSSFDFYLPSSNLNAKLNNVSIYFNNKLVQLKHKRDNNKQIYLIIIILCIVILFVAILLIKRGVIHGHKNNK